MTEARDDRRPAMAPSGSDDGSAEILSFLRELVLRAGEKLLEVREHLQVDAKGPVNLVTEVDMELEELLVDALRARFPDWAVVSEEGRARDELEGRPCWYVDPLDGTTNFVHGHPFHVISIGGWQGHRPVAGVVYAPVLDELFMASAGNGATLENPRRGGPARPLALRPCTRLAEALLATGFPYQRAEVCRLNLRCAGEALARAQGLRRGGSAALDLCYLAAGRLDGFWEPTLRPWDVAAGSVIAGEAGAVVTDYTGGDDFLWGRRIVAAGAAVHPQLLEMLREAHARPEEWPLGSPLSAPVPLTPAEGEEGL